MSLLHSTPMRQFSQKQVHQSKVCNVRVLGKPQLPTLARKNHLTYTPCAAASSASADLPIVGSRNEFWKSVTTAVKWSSPYDKEIFKIAVPLLATFLIEPINGAVSAAIVGHLGTQQLSALSVGSLTVQFFFILFVFLNLLTTPAVAAAVAKNDKEEVSLIASRGFWVGLVAASIISVLVYLGAPSIVGAMKTAEAKVADYAIDVLRVRAFSIIPSMLSYVSIGTFRGHKDTFTPLLCLGAAGVISIALNFGLVYGLKMGVVGSALATNTGLFTSCFLMWTLLLKRGMVQGQQLLRPPSLKAVAPLLKKGLVMAIRTCLLFGMVIYGSTLCVRTGTAVHAGFEVMRQLFLVFTAFFACLDVAIQSACGAYLGLKDYVNARRLMERAMAWSLLAALVLGVGQFTFQEPIIRVFTNDPAVVAQALSAIPVACAMFLTDAVGEIYDGSLLAAGQPYYFALIQSGAAIIQIVLLTMLSKHGLTLAGVWTIFRMAGVCRAVFGFHRVYISKDSGYYPKE